MAGMRLTDRAEIRAFLNRDRGLSAYALGDLDDAFWPQSFFMGARQDGKLAAVVLLYQGFDPPVLTAYGDPADVCAALDRHALPEEVYYLCPEPLESVLRDYYDLSHLHREWRMVLDAAAFPQVDLGNVRRIVPDMAAELAALYQHAAEPGEAVAAFDPWQIAHGVFFGVWEGDQLVATAGPHVWSQAEGVAAVGNVFTMPECRGKGYATRCTAAVTRVALETGLDTIVLNVRHDNAPAVHVYEKLGFRCSQLFIEGPGLKVNNQPVA